MDDALCISSTRSLGEFREDWEDVLDDIFFPKKVCRRCERRENLCPCDSPALNPLRKGANDEALAICARCPVRSECLETCIEMLHAHRDMSPSGVWGATTEVERRRYNPHQLRYLSWARANRHTVGIDTGEAAVKVLGSFSQPALKTSSLNRTGQVGNAALEEEQQHRPC